MIYDEKFMDELWRNISMLSDEEIHASWVKAEKLTKEGSELFHPVMYFILQTVFFTTPKSFENFVRKDGLPLSNGLALILQYVKREIEIWLVMNIDLLDLIKLYSSNFDYKVISKNNIEITNFHKISENIESIFSNMEDRSERIRIVKLLSGLEYINTLDTMIRDVYRIDISEILGYIFILFKCMVQFAGIASISDGRLIQINRIGKEGKNRVSHEPYKVFLRRHFPDYASKDPVALWKAIQNRMLYEIMSADGKRVIKQSHKMQCNGCQISFDYKHLSSNEQPGGLVQKFPKKKRHVIGFDIFSRILSGMKKIGKN
ncbi:MAG: hypothetical protein AB7D07_04610 [Desulfovibrionaceae bacterium]